MKIWYLKSMSWAPDRWGWEALGRSRPRSRWTWRVREGAKWSSSWLQLNWRRRNFALFYSHMYQFNLTFSFSLCDILGLVNYIRTNNESYRRVSNDIYSANVALNMVLQQIQMYDFQAQRKSNFFPRLLIILHSSLSGEHFFARRMKYFCETETTTISNCGFPASDCFSVTSLEPPPVNTNKSVCVYIGLDSSVTIEWMKGVCKKGVNYLATYVKAATTATTTSSSHLWHFQLGSVSWSPALSSS